MRGDDDEREGEKSVKEKIDEEEEKWGEQGGGRRR